MMVGLGESDAEIVQVLEDLRAVGVDIVTLGQYLQPTRRHKPVDRFVSPEGFRRLEVLAREMGFPVVYAGVFVRSSFNAGEVFHGHTVTSAEPGTGNGRGQGLAVIPEPEA
jgi:lipoic acid synthetase